MRKSEKDLQHKLGFFHCPEQANFQDKVTINQHEFTTYRASESHDVIFFQEAGNTSALVLGIVCVIFLVKQDNVTHIPSSTLLSYAYHIATKPFCTLPGVWCKFMVVRDAEKSDDRAWKSEDLPCYLPKLGLQNHGNEAIEQSQ